MGQWTLVCNYPSFQYIWGLGVFNNRLYGGTGNNPTGGRLFRLNLAENAWEQVCSQLNNQIHITSNLVVYNGRLYGGTYDANLNDGGRLFRLNLAGDAWEQVCAKIDSQTGIYSLCEFEGRLYAAGHRYLTVHDARLLRLNLAGDAWEQVCANLYGEKHVFSLCVFEGRLYGSTGQDSDDGRLLRLNLAGDAWEQVCAKFNSQISVYSLCEFEGRLYGGTGDNGRLFRLNLAGNAWEEVCATLVDNYIRHIFVYNNRLYGGSGSGKLLRLNLAGNAWEIVCNNNLGAINALQDFENSLYASAGYTGNLLVLTYNLTYIAGINGSITGSLLQTVKSGGNGTQVIAIPDPGYAFSSWSDGYPTAARTDLNVTGDKTVTANFILLPIYTLTYIAGTGGTLTGSTSQTVIQGNNGSQVTAVPNTGYYFLNWSDGLTTPSRTDLNVQSDKIVTANFISKFQEGLGLTKTIFLVEPDWK